MLQEKMKRRMSALGAGLGGGRSSESSAMASGPPDVMTNQEAAEAAEECSGKKKSKFQTFKKFFTRKKRKEPSSSGAEAALKGSQSTDNISKTSENNTLTQSEKEKGSGSKISLGSKALSHDSVFVSDSSEANEALGASQDSIHGKVKSLQLQLKQAIRLGSPPSLMCVKRTEDMGTMSEDDGLPCSPPEYTTHTALAQVQGNSSISLEGTDSDEDQLSCAASSRAVSPLVVVPGDFSQPASPFACLDNSAAKHKLGLRHKACNKRKPANRLELKAEGDSVVEDILSSSVSEAVEENNEQKVKDASADEFKPKEEEEEEEEEDKDQAEHSRQSLLSDKEEREESSSEPEVEQDVCDGPDTSCPPETGLSEEEAPEARPSSSSVDSPRGTPEPPVGQREYLMDPPGTVYETEENRDRSDSELGLTGGEDGEQETEEEEEKEESSFLQEVLSSLKTPLNSLVETESIVLEMEMEQEEGKNREDEKEEEEEEKAETEEGEEVKEEEEDVEEAVMDQAVVSGSSVSDQNTKEEEEEEEVTTTTASYNDAKEEVKHVEEEEEEEDSTEEEEEEEEELVVEHFSQYDQVEEVEKDVEKTEAEEENSLHAKQTDNQMEEEGEEKKTEEKEEEEEEEEKEEEEEEEEEAKELEQEPEAKGEKLEKTVEDDKEDEVEVEEKTEEVEEPEEAKEDEKEDIQEKTFSEADGGEMVVDLEETADDVNAVNKDEMEYEKHGDQILPGQEEEDFVMMHESQKALDQMEPKEQNLDQEKDTAATEPNVEERTSEQDEEQESIQEFPQETKQEKEPSDVDTSVSSRPSSLTPPQTPTSPSKTSTIHINLVSPSAEKSASCFPLPPSTVEAKESTSTAEEPGNEVEKAEEEEAAKQSCDAATATNKEAKVSAPADETSKVRFTITPAWQRSLSIGDKDSSTLPSSSPAVGGTTVEEPLDKPESSSAKTELVLSPSRAKPVEMTTTKPQWNTSASPGKPQMEAKDESSVVVEGNPNNPFGVRLRKTSALHRFSSEEENAEPVHESSPQPSSCTADTPQPLGVKPSVSQPMSNKPALPKKPEVTGDGGGKTKRILDPSAARGGSDPPSWISVAKQKQKVYKENSLDNTAVHKEEQERRSSLPMNSSSNKTPESSSKVSPLELNKSSASVEKESRRSLSPPTPVPPQPSKSPSLPFPVPPKPHVTTSTTPKPSPQRSLSPPTPVPVAQRPPSCTSPPSTSKPAPSLPTGNMTLTSPPFSSSRTTPAQSAGSSPTPAAQRGVPSPALTQDEPPWMALAKKKAKAWSEMPQIVQ
ncbi:cancer-related regulator of actin dynamics isoform X2 [Sphaeramia orbicularis]|uniref:cancer-related regulator of actin dynamics isoform X2 n=1 Tax=Sphaeramia orbicularis TaxID=375764 RepID=UPI00118170EA|nr:cancer-related regulator of actin dynamics-like isoform X2 [Sphaeramia orbicularis]